MCTTQSGNREDQFGALQERILKIMDRLDKRFQVKAKVHEVMQLAKANPHVAVIAGVTFFVCLLPLLGFAAFVAITCLLGVMGFVVVEGFLVSVGAVILLGILAILAAVSVASSGLVVLMWLLAKHGRSGLQQFLNGFSSDNHQPSNEPRVEHVEPREKPLDKEA